MRKIILLITCCFSSFIIAQNLDKKTDFQIIEVVPIHPECNQSLTNFEKKKCMSTNINELIGKEFNVGLAYTLGLTGRQRISVAFKINQLGNVVDIKATGAHHFLKKETIRVIKILPKFKPGYQRGKPVTVPYSLPIIFEVEGNEKPKKKTPQKLNNNNIQPEVFPVFRSCKENLGNDYLKKCTTDKIINYIKVSFDTELVSNLFPQKQSTKFKVEFVVNKKGKVEQVSAKANHRAIAAEAIRVLKRIPKFKKPGYTNGKAIDTPFSIIMTVHFQEF